MNICLCAKFQVWLCYGFGSTALQQDSAEGEEEEDDKEHEKTCFAVSSSLMLCRNTYIFGEFILFCMF